LGQAALIAAGLAFAIAFAPIALALSAAWFLARTVIYATAKRASAEIVGWQGQGDPEQVETAVAYPELTFLDHDDVGRRFTSRIGFRVHDDPPPQGLQRIRYHTWPRFYAELDRPSELFTGPVLAMVLALTGTFLGWLARLLALTWF
jgi:hypothetical protein